MTTSWYIARNKQKFGPFSTNQLHQLALLGLVRPGEFVLAEGARKWVEAKSVAGVFPPSDAPARYWLLIGGKAHGPHAEEPVRLALAQGRLPPDTPACPEGGRGWTALKEMAAFKAFAPAPRDSHAHLGVGSSHLDLSAEEAEFHLAGKRGDVIARLISTLLDLRRKYHANRSMVDLIDKNVHDLKAIRARQVPEFGTALAAAGKPGG
jgi:hypothetical protein